MPEIKVNIAFDVGGTDQFKGLFTKPVKDMAQIQGMMKRLAGAKVGQLFGKAKVTQEVKEAAEYAEKYLQTMIKAKNLTGKRGSGLNIAGIEATLSRDEIGRYSMKGKQTVRKASAGGGQSQLAYAETLKRSIDAAYADMNRNLSLALSKIPAQVDSGRFASNMLKALRQSQAKILTDYRAALSSKEGMTSKAGEQIRQAKKTLFANISQDISRFVGAATTSQTGAENIGVKIGDFRAKLANEINSIAGAMGGKVPADVAKLASGYREWISAMEADVNEKRRTASLTKSMAKKYEVELAREHSERMSAISKAIALTQAQSKAQERGRGVEGNVEIMFQEMLEKLRQKVSTATTGVKIDPAMGGELQANVGAKLAELQRSLVVAFDNLKMAAGGVATPAMLTEIKAKAEQGVSEIAKMVTDVTSKVKSSQGLADGLSKEFIELRRRMVGGIRKSASVFSGGEAPAEMKAIRANFGDYLAKVNNGVARLASMGKMTPIMAAKLKGVVENTFDRMSKDIVDIGIAEKKAQSAALTALNKSKSDAVQFENRILEARRTLSESVRTTISRQLDSLNLEKIGANFLKRPGIEKVMQRLQQVMEGMVAEIDVWTPKTMDELHKYLAKMRESANSAVASSKAQKRADVGGTLSGVLFNRATVQSFAAVFGQMMSTMGAQIAKFAESTRLRGQLTSGLSDLFMGAFMTSKFLIFAEVTKIAGGVVEIFINFITELPRQIMGIVGGFFASLGGAIKAGVATSMWIAVAAVGTALAPISAGISAIVGLVVAAVMAIQAFLTGLGNFLSSFISSIMTVAYSILKAGIMVISSIIKGMAGVIKAAFTGLYEFIKESTTKFVDFMKDAFDKLTKFMSDSIMEFVSQSEYATRAFKETVGVAGQSLSKFQGLIQSLRSNFGFKKEDVGEAVFDVVSSGYRSIADAQRISAASAALAVSSESDLATATNAMITAFQNFSGEGETVNSIFKTIAAATTLGRMTMQELGGSMKSVMGLASKVKMSFQDTMMSLSMMTRVFGRGSIDQGARYFNRFLEAIYMPSSRASKSVAELGVNVENLGKGTMMQGVFEIVDKLKNLELKDVNKIFTTIQSRRAWLGLTKDVDQFKQMMTDMGTVSEGVGWQLEQMMNTPQRMMSQLAESFGAFKAIIGEQLWALVAKGMKSLVTWAQEMISLLQSDRVRKFFSSFVEWASPIVNTVLGPILGFLDKIYVYLNKGFGGGDLSNIFKTESAMKIQAIIINIVNNIKALSMWVIGLVRDSELIGKAWSVVSDTIANVFEYFGSTTWKNWVSDVLNIGVKIKDMFKNLFTGMDISWAQDMVNEIIKIIIQALLSIGKVIELMFMPIFDRMMALVGVKLKNSLIRGFSDAIDFFASNIGTTGVFGSIGEELQTMLRKIAMMNKSGRVKTKVASSNTGWGDIAQGVAGMVSSASSYSLTGLLAKASSAQQVAKGLSRKSGLKMATSGIVETRNHEEVQQLESALSRYIPSLIDALRNSGDPGGGINLNRGSNRYAKDTGYDLKELALNAIRQLSYIESPTGEYDLNKILAAFDKNATVLSNLASPVYRQKIGMSEEEYGASGIDKFNEIFARVAADYNDKLEMLTYTTDDIGKAMPKVEDELVKFAKQLGASSSEIARLFGEKWKSLDNAFSPEGFQDVATGAKKSTTAQDKLKQYDALERAIRAEEDKWKKSAGNSQRWNSREWAGRGNESLSEAEANATGPNGELAKDEASRSSRIESLIDKQNRLVEKYGSREELAKAATSERKSNYQVDIGNASNDELNKEYNRLKKKSAMYSSEGEGKYTRRAREAEASGNFAQAQGYRDEAKARGESTKKYESMQEKMRMIKEEAESRKAKKKIQDETAASIAAATSPEERDKAAAEGEKKLREQEIARNEQLMARIDDKIKRDVAGGGQAQTSDVKTKEELQKRNDELARQAAEAANLEKQKQAEQAAKDAATAADLEAPKQTNLLKTSAEALTLLLQQGEKNTANTKSIAQSIIQIGALMNQTTNPSTAGKAESSKWWSEQVGAVV